MPIVVAAEDMVVDMEVVVTAAEEVAMEILPVANLPGGKQHQLPLLARFLYTHFASTPGRRPTWRKFAPKRHRGESTLD